MVGCQDFVGCGGGFETYNDKNGNNIIKINYSGCDCIEIFDVNSVNMNDKGETSKLNLNYDSACNGSLFNGTSCSGSSCNGTSCSGSTYSGNSGGTYLHLYSNYN